MYIHRCDKCGAELKTIYVADGIVDYIGFGKGNSIDLCENCNNELINIIKLWWNDAKNTKES